MLFRIFHFLDRFKCKKIKFLLWSVDAVMLSVFVSVLVLNVCIVQIVLSELWLVLVENVVFECELLQPKLSPQTSKISLGIEVTFDSKVNSVLKNVDKLKFL